MEEPTVEETVPVIEEVDTQEELIVRPSNNTSRRTDTTRISSGSNNSQVIAPVRTEDNTNTSVVTPAAPKIEVTPERVVILAGKSYDLMTGVSVLSEEALSATANVTNTAYLSVGSHDIIYSVTDSYGQSATAKRVLVVLDPDADEDEDGYTNRSEMENNFEPEDENSHPALPTIKLKGQNPQIVLEAQEYVEAGYEFTADITDTETKEATISGEVNTDKIGTYVLT